MTVVRSARRYRVTGQVQGVGYRPWVFREARALKLCGWVRNDLAGVVITVWGEPHPIREFVQRLHASAPPMARIHEIREEAPPAGATEPTDFRILPSEMSGIGQCPTPDIATCADCLNELFDRAARRYQYPFTSCSQCGPRISIQRTLPWDRACTTMHPFPLCAACHAEYENPADRRYHAQPLACPNCGPSLDYAEPGARTVTGNGPALAAATDLLRAGGILAIKGTGGWQLACDAAHDGPVQKLRTRKHRPDKPFALMARDLACVRQYCAPDNLEVQALTGPAAPIVLLDITGNGLPDSLAPRLRQLGFMLPHSPLHHLLLETFEQPLVMTRGNVSGEPQIICDEEAHSRLAGIADGFLGHNREIAQRVDDAVLHCHGGILQTLRAGRGVAPLQLTLEGATEHLPVMALGSHLKNSVAIAQGGLVTLSPHIGDLDTPRARQEAVATSTLFRSLLSEPPALLACDQHPDYASTQAARRLADELGTPLRGIQHHHAHFAACLLEHGMPLSSPPVLGIVLDGLGYGADRRLWGGEFLLGGYASCQRVATFKPVPLPGGTRALREPWRNLLAHIAAELGLSWLRLNFAHLEISRFLLDPDRAPLVAILGDTTLAPPASSCGRLFDAVAAAVGICREQISYEGQAAMELQACIDPEALKASGEEAAYPMSAPLLRGNGLPYLEPMAMWQALFGDLHLGTPIGVIAARFHRGLAEGIARLAGRLQGGAAAEARFHHVVLSGGVFQNRTLLQLVKAELEQFGLTVLSAQRIPAGDGGIAAGQAAIAAAQGS